MKRHRKECSAVTEALKAYLENRLKSCDKSVCEKTGVSKAKRCTKNAKRVILPERKSLESARRGHDSSYTTARSRRSNSLLGGTGYQFTFYLEALSRRLTTAFGDQLQCAQYVLRYLADNVSEKCVEKPDLWYQGQLKTHVEKPDVVTWNRCENRLGYQKSNEKMQLENTIHVTRDHYEWINARQGKWWRNLK